jgi:hypothetical protein
LEKRGGTRDKMSWHTPVLGVGRFDVPPAFPPLRQCPRYVQTGGKRTEPCGTLTGEEMARL